LTKTKTMQVFLMMKMI